MRSTIKVIDLFAGPGGLGEGFFSYQNKQGCYPFEGLISIEKDKSAHATLTLRAFYRLLKKKGVKPPTQYYKYAKGEIETPACVKTLELWEQANKETLKLELGNDPESDQKLIDSIKAQQRKDSNESPTLLIGGPPCQAYSLVGRARNKGNKAYVAEKDHRHFLYKEYLSIMESFSPDIFVMENVKGMLSSKVGGGAVFDQIVEDLESCSTGYTLFSLKTGQQFIRGYTDPKDLILNAEDYGIPQNRHRVIILGIKKGTAEPSSIPSLKAKPRVSVEEAIGDLPRIRSTLSSRGEQYDEDSLQNWKDNLEIGVNHLIINECLDTKLKDALLKNLESALASAWDQSKKPKFLKPKSLSPYEHFVKDSQGQTISLHNARPHMDRDLLRYFFCSTYRELYGRNAKASDFPISLAPAHKNWDSGKFVDRFKVQSFKAQSSTITSHISKDGHYFIHSDPTQVRSLSVREAARLQSFPDSYHFMGERTNQYHQVGNAVPPLLAKQIAEIVYEILMF